MGGKGETGDGDLTEKGKRKRVLGSSEERRHVSCHTGRPKDVDGLTFTTERSSDASKTGGVAAPIPWFPSLGEGVHMASL